MIIDNKQEIVKFMEREVLSSGGTVCDKFFDDWAMAKNLFLANYFNGSLILKKKVLLEKDTSEMEKSVERIWSMIVDSAFLALPGDDFCAMKRIMTVGSLSRNEIDYEAEVNSRASGKKVKIQKGARVSRVLKHFVMPQDLENIQVEYSKAFNDKMLSGWLNISIHPLDYLTMSINNSGWQSCLNAYHGCYRAGAGALMNSPNSMIAYFTTTEQDTVELTDTLDWNDKKWRTVLSVNEGKYIHVNRQYPYTSDMLREELMNFAQEIFFPEEEMSKTTNKEDYDIHVSLNEDIMYNDAKYHATWVRIVKKRKPSIKNTTLVISDNGTCPCCGEEKVDMSRHFECADCGDFPKCLCCGRAVDTEDDDVIYSSRDEGYICYSCGNDYTWCDFCEDYVHMDDIRDFGVYRVCTCCIDRNNLIECEDCGTYMEEEDVCKYKDLEDNIIHLCSHCYGTRG